MGLRVLSILAEDTDFVHSALWLLRTARNSNSGLSNALTSWTLGMHIK